MTRRIGLSSWDFVPALTMAVACLITSWIITRDLARFDDRPDVLLGSMWAVIGTVFVFRETRSEGLSAGTQIVDLGCRSCPGLKAAQAGRLA